MPLTSVVPYDLTAALILEAACIILFLGLRWWSAAIIIAFLGCMMIGSIVATMTLCALLSAALFTAALTTFLIRAVPLIPYQHTQQVSPKNHLHAEEIIRTMLIALHRATAMRIIIEGEKPLASYLNTAATLNAPWSPHMIDIILRSHAPHEPLSLMLTRSNIILGIDVQISPKLTLSELTCRTDGIVIESHLGSRTWTITAHGKSTPPLPATHAIPYLQELLAAPATPQNHPTEPRS